MVLPDPTVTNPPAPPAPAPEPTPAPQPAPAPGEDYEKRYKGLQRTYDTLQAKAQKLEEEKSALLGDTELLRQNEKKYTDDLKKVQDELTALKAEKENLTTQLTSHQTLLTRSKLIMGEFSDLALFEANGLLPAATTEEEMRSLFTKFRETYTKAVGDGVQKKVAGAGPAPTGGGEPPALSKESIYAEMTRLAGSKPGTKERTRYEELLRQWDELHKQPTS